MRATGYCRPGADALRRHPSCHSQCCPVAPDEGNTDETAICARNNYMRNVQPLHRVRNNTILINELLQDIYTMFMVSH